MPKRDKRERHRDDDESRRRKKKKKKKKQEKRERGRSERSSSSMHGADEALSQVGPEQIKSACDILMSLLELYPDAREELFSLFQILDEGESVAVDCIEDKMVKDSVVLLLDLLRLKSEVSEFGKAYSKTPTTIGLVESFSDIVGPPPDSAAAAHREHRTTSTDRVIGPSMPTQADQALALAQRESDNDDADELVGPLLPALAPPISEDELERRRIDREKEWKRVMASDSASEKTAGPGGREEWMTALPTNRTGISAAAGLQARSFMADGIAEIGDTSQWTDSAEDKQRKLETRLREKEICKERRKAVGVARRPVHATASTSKVEQASRGPSLLDQHRQAMHSSRVAATQPEPYRAWDRDRDMNQGSVDTKALREVVQKAKQLGSKFSHATL